MNTVTWVINKAVRNQRLVLSYYNGDEDNETKNSDKTEPKSVWIKPTMSAPIPVSPVWPFDPHGDPTSVPQRWKKWIRSFDTYASAAGCTDKKQLRQLLLHSAGPGVQDNFDTLTNTGDDADTARAKLLEYFTLLQNVPFNRHVFRQEGQSEKESVAHFVKQRTHYRWRSRRGHQ